MDNFAAIILAAGFSSRMGLYKPLLPLGNALVLEKSLSTFLTAGIKNVYVVVGHNAHLLKPVVERMGAQWIENTNFAQGMYSSVQAGVKNLPREIKAFFMLPADIPLVQAETIKKLMDMYVQSPAEVIFPVHDNRKGHPPLIATQLRAEILQPEPLGGLKTILNKAKNKKLLHVDDEGVLKDLDREEHYRRMLPPAAAGYPTRSECEQILAAHNVLPQVILHMEQVNKLAQMMALYLNSCGYRLHLALLQAACLLHDIAKGQKNHAEKGGQLLANLGYKEVASLVATHMNLPAAHEELDEAVLLFLADKMVEGTEIVSLAQKKRKKHAFFAGNAAAQQAVESRLQKALFWQQKIEQVIGKPILEIAGESK